MLRDSSQRLDALVTQFLKLAQAEAGMSGEQREPLDLAALCVAVSERLRADGRFSSTTVLVEAPHAAPLVGVEDRLESVIENLLANALSFAGPSASRSETLIARGRKIWPSISTN